MTDFFDLTQAEFEALFLSFVGGGGLDATRPMNEDYERTYRLHVICKHGRHKRQCEVCYVPLPTYFPDSR